MAKNGYVAIVTVVLECKHQLDFKYSTPEVGELTWCQRCQLYRKVESHVEQYRLRCTRCNFSHKYGTDAEKASVAANKHVARYQTHGVKIWLGERHLRTVQYFGDELPISEARKTLPDDHTRSLRMIK